MLSEAGFAATHVYWAVEDEVGPDGYGRWERREKAPSDASWTCYLVAVK